MTTPNKLPRISIMVLVLDSEPATEVDVDDWAAGTDSDGTCEAVELMGLPEEAEVFVDNVFVSRQSMVPLVMLDTTRLYDLN